MTTNRHVFTILVHNEAGVLVRVLGLFAARGYNVENLSVAEIDPVQKQSRITLVTSGTAQVIEQIARQLDRLVPVLRVQNLTTQGALIEREVALFKLTPAPTQQAQIDQLLQQYNGRIIERCANGAIVVEASNTSVQIDSLLQALTPLGLTEHARTGVTAMGV